ncbi:purple acid phosphatase family protein [Pleomorphovibrio marinus]|uniref:purple acid phosphatase family protein n=1 Tax=Pleomorphovibrio marinus TaxID=2164132 RepID=UPI000E0C0BAF|nr:metallophosphoesterase family protein [Pleomorphovibrio marinus]
MKIKIKVIVHLFFLTVGALGIFLVSHAQSENKVSVNDLNRTYLPSKVPDRVILNLSDEPLKSVAVNWRTSVQEKNGEVQWAEATVGTGFLDQVKTKKANSEFLSVRHDENPTIESYYHAATISDLEPGKSYVYRVGYGEFWSEWFQFDMPDPSERGLTFFYFGDAQNGVRDHWSRLLRQAYLRHPQIDFSLHAGDLINRYNNDFEWGEWFGAGGFIHATVPSMMTPGNHEYGKDEQLSPQWRPQFNLPLNGPAGTEETCYQVNFPHVKMISLNAEEIEESPYLKQKQVEWLDSILTHDSREWTVITIHHPFYSTKDNRDNKDLRKHFKPLMDKHQVDLVLQGHDHGYGRGMVGASENGDITEVQAGEEGTMYVVSMAGIKMYEVLDLPWMQRRASLTQMYQLIHVSLEGVLSFEAYTADGNLYDAFELHKGPDGKNKRIDKIPDIPEYLESRK